MRSAQIGIYIGYLDKADSDNKRVQIMNWVLHYLVCNILPNVRLDLIANQARPGQLPFGLTG